MIKIKDCLYDEIPFFKHVLVILVTGISSEAIVKWIVHLTGIYEFIPAAIFVLIFFVPFQFWSTYMVGIDGVGWGIQVEARKNLRLNKETKGDKYK